MGSRRESLLAWIALLPQYAGTRKNPKMEDFHDGMMVGKILKESIDPESFADISTDVKNPTPLATLVNKMKQYFAQQETGHTIPFTMTPNAGKIVSSGDVTEVCRLLQLLLVCAINSPHAETFVSTIQNLAQDQQSEIMLAIKELMNEGGTPTDAHYNSLQDQLRKAHEDILMLKDEKDQLNQTCHEVQVKLKEIMDEKSTLMAENEKLVSQLAGSENDPQSLRVNVNSHLHDECKREIEQLREDNYKLESIIDDHKPKLHVMERELSEAHAKLASAAALEGEVARLKDEIDSLREAAGNASKYEQSINTLRKRLEEMQDLKISMKQLEEKNAELDKANFNLEDELKKVNTWKTQLEAVKKELAEQVQLLSQEKQRSLKAEYDLQLFRGKFADEKKLTESLKEEKSKLAQELEDLQLNARGQVLTDSPGTSVNSMQLLPPDVRQRMSRLELENKKLKEDLKATLESNPSDAGARILVEELRKHEATLEQKLLKTQSSYEEKIRTLQEQIATKDNELRRKEEQYNKCMEKAKSVITALTPSDKPSSHMDAARTEAEIDRARLVRETEEKLLASAFYNYGLSMHRNAVEVRNSTLLQRQRTNVASRRKSDLLN